MESITNRSMYNWLAVVFGTFPLFFLSPYIHAKDFADVSYYGDAVAWRVELPREATGVTLSVVFTPADITQDSYLDRKTYQKGEEITYPLSSELEDGTYTWELRLENRGADIIGFSPKKPEGRIDENGRQIEIVGYNPPPKGRIRLSNSGRDSIQTGGFTVIDGMIPDPKEQEK